MPVICFASPKAASASPPARSCSPPNWPAEAPQVVVIDADPNRPVSTGRAGPANPYGHRAVRRHRGHRDRRDRGRRARVPFVVVDLEGTASMTVAYAISRADLVVIPVQGSQLDAAEAAKAVRLIRQQEKAFGRRIAHAVLFTRTSTVIRPGLLGHISGRSSAAGVPVLRAQMHEREAFRAVFSFGGTVDTLLPAQVTGLNGAIANVRDFAAEIVALLRRAKAEAAA